MTSKPVIDFSVIPAARLPEDEYRSVHRLFQQAYQDANTAYLEKSFAKLGYIALATVEQTLIGFALADAVRTPLPRLEDEQVIVLAGICCVDSDYRRMGLFSRLELMAAGANGLLRGDIRVLACGRMAHPASFRVISRTPAVIPKPGVPLSSWHKEVSLKVAELYGVRIDPETLIVIGDGEPIGYPKIIQDVTEEEASLFKIG